MSHLALGGRGAPALACSGSAQQRQKRTSSAALWHSRQHHHLPAAAAAASIPQPQLRQRRRRAHRLVSCPAAGAGSPDAAAADTTTTPTTSTTSSTATYYTCARCRRQFAADGNARDACRFHPALYTGGEVAKAVGFVRQSAAPEHQLGAVLGRTGLLRFWDCCGAEDEGAEGCEKASHISGDDAVNRARGWR